VLPSCWFAMTFSLEPLFLLPLLGVLLLLELRLVLRLLALHNVQRRSCSARSLIIVF